MSQIYDNKGITCLFCKIPFPKRMTMANGRGGALHKGMIMVCSSCGGAMILGDSSWRPLTKADFDKLPLPSKRALVAVANGLKTKLQAGQEWSPYEGN